MAIPRGLRVRLKRWSYGGIGGGRDGERVVTWLSVEPAMRIADIGSGFGDFAMRFADAVGPRGVVYAVDTDEDLREEVASAARQRGLDQIVPTAATPDDPGIPEPVDMMFFSSSYHHLPDRDRYFARLSVRLRDGGTVVVLEPRPSLLTGWFGHSTAPEEVRSTLQGAGFRLVASADFVPRESLQRFALDDRLASAGPRG
jgi:predicted methyltransferase